MAYSLRAKINLDLNKLKKMIRLADEKLNPIILWLLENPVNYKENFSGKKCEDILLVCVLIKKISEMLDSQSGFELRGIQFSINKYDIAINSSRIIRDRTVNTDAILFMQIIDMYNFLEEVKNLMEKFLIVKNSSIQRFTKISSQQQTIYNLPQNRFIVMQSIQSSESYNYSNNSKPATINSGSEAKKLITKCMEDLNNLYNYLDIKKEDKATDSPYFERLSLQKSNANSKEISYNNSCRCSVSPKGENNNIVVSIKGCTEDEANINFIIHQCSQCEEVNKNVVNLNGREKSEEIESNGTETTEQIIKDIMLADAESNKEEHQHIESQIELKQSLSEEDEFVGVEKQEEEEEEEDKGEEGVEKEKEEEQQSEISDDISNHERPQKKAKRLIKTLSKVLCLNRENSDDTLVKQESTEQQDNLTTTTINESDEANDLKQRRTKIKLNETKKLTLNTDSGEKLDIFVRICPNYQSSNSNQTYNVQNHPFIRSALGTPKANYCQQSSTLSVDNNYAISFQLKKSNHGLMIGNAKNHINDDLGINVKKSRCSTDLLTDLRKCINTHQVMYIFVQKNPLFNWRKSKIQEKFNYFINLDKHVNVKLMDINLIRFKCKNYNKYFSAVFNRMFHEMLFHLATNVNFKRKKRKIGNNSHNPTRKLINSMQYFIYQCCACEKFHENTTILPLCDDLNNEVCRKCGCSISDCKKLWKSKQPNKKSYFSRIKSTFSGAFSKLLSGCRKEQQTDDNGKTHNIEFCVPKNTKIIVCDTKKKRRSATQASMRTCACDRDNNGSCSHCLDNRSSKTVDTKEIGTSCECSTANLASSDKEPSTKTILENGSKNKLYSQSSKSSMKNSKSREKSQEINSKNDELLKNTEEQ